MKAKNLSVNKALIGIISFLITSSALMLCVLYHFTSSFIAVWLCLAYIVIVLLSVFLFILFIQQKLALFSDSLCELLDGLLVSDSELPQAAEEDSLFYKINHRIVRLYKIMQENRNHVAKERADLQELISDISHQVKTPIANLQMINTTLLEQPVPDEKRQELLRASEGQLEKLDFLMQAMIKTSRLETGVISLHKKIQPVYCTLAAALGGILLNAEKKEIHVSVDCPEDIIVSHDRKWTGEALFNILDNAVKYTQVGGSINVHVQSWEMYTKIDITDNGRGIPETKQGLIFKRFYREDEVHDAEGIGIGLYLAREIITMQSGYILVSSEIGHGTTFSIFLPK